MRVEASAPCRLDFAGGWTDVAPYSTDRHGVVVNAAIDLRATALVELGGESHRLESSGSLDLLKAAIRLSEIGPCRLTTRSDAPAGSGLGSSGALDVALVAALDRAMGVTRSPADTAERAWQLEAIEAGLPGGRQDQYAAALGGFHRLEFSADRVRFEPLSIPTDFASWLERHLVVCYTGQSRVSGDTIARVMGRYRNGDSVVTAALEGLAETADGMGQALAAGDPAEVGRLLTTNWRHQQALDAGIRTARMQELEMIMTAAGALGGKAAGAGAGGSMFFLVGNDPEGAKQATRAAGMEVLPLQWDHHGVLVW